MKTWLIVPQDLFATLTIHCDKLTWQYKFMMAGVIQEDENRRVRILADSDTATRFVAWAEGCAPGARALIKLRPEIEDHADR